MQLIETILQFDQRGMVSNIMKRFDVQVDVLNQLGQRLENTLRRLEIDEQGDRTEAAKRRATLVKLGRDYRRIETSYKNILLEAKQKKSRLAAQKQKQSTSAFSYSQKSNTPEEEQISMQLQMQQDVSFYRHCKVKILAWR